MTGLILEGGGMRGAFTAGVLDSFLKKGIRFDSVYGVSAGASNGTSYISEQFERNRKIFIDGVKTHNYFSIKNVFTQRNLLDVKLLFDTYPNSLIPLDYKTFSESPSKFYTVLTDCLSGKPVYIERSSVSPEVFLMKVLAGSNSLPLLSPAVYLDGRPHLDGGLSDSIPLKRAIEDGCSRNVVILTRERGYRKTASGLNGIIRRVYRKWPEMVSSFENRHINYNEAVDFCESRENEGSAILIRPETTMDVSRTERDVTKLEKLYLHGFEAGERAAAGIKDF